MRLRHLSPRTEEANLARMRCFHAFHGRRDPLELCAEHVTAFLDAPATRSRVSASTRNQPFAALLFLDREVLETDRAWWSAPVHATTPVRLPLALSRGELRAVLARMEGVQHSMAMLMYGSRLRLLECCRLRVKDVELRVLVKRILRTHGYPPDKQEKAGQTVLGQAALLSAEWATT